MGEIRNAYKILVEKLEMEDSITMEIG